MGIFLVGLLVAALVYGGRIYQNTSILVCWTCVWGKNPLIHVLNDCILGEKKQNICHLQSLKAPQVANKLPFFWGDKNTMESSSTPPKPSMGLAYLYMSLPLPIKTTNQVMYFKVNMQSPTCFSIGYAWPGALTGGFSARLRVPVTPPRPRYSTLESIQWASHVGHWSEWTSGRNQVKVVFGWMVPGDLAMYKLQVIMVIYAMAGREEAFLLLKTSCIHTNAWFSRMSSSILWPDGRCNKSFCWTDFAQLFFPFRLCVSTGFLRIFEQGLKTTLFLCSV